MNSMFRYSSGSPVARLSLSDVISAMQKCWITHFWSPENVKGDQGYNKKKCKGYLEQVGSNFRPSPSRRPSKNSIESKQRIIKDIYIGLRHYNSNADDRLLILHSIKISNDLYGNDIASRCNISLDI